MNDLTRYLAVRAQMRPGDVIAFAGVELISRLIGVFTDSDLSHVGMVRQGVHPSGAGLPACQVTDVLMTESTIERGVSGPQSHPLGETLANYGDGARAWWLPLSESVRAGIDWFKFYQFIGAEEGAARYDVGGLFGFIARQIPIVGAYLCQSENAKRFFCSGYDTATFEAAGVLRGINWSQVSPRQLASMRLYSGCVQLIGDPARGAGTPAQIKGWNTV